MRKYQHVLSLIFTIDEINKNPKLLSNVTLGFRIYDNFFNLRTTHEIILDLLFTQQKIAHKYMCGRENGVLSVMGEFPIESLLETASIFSICKIPQVGTSAFFFWREYLFSDPVFLLCRTLQLEQLFNILSIQITVNFPFCR